LGCNLLGSQCCQAFCRTRFTTPSSSEYSLTLSLYFSSNAGALNLFSSTNATVVLLFASEHYTKYLLELPKFINTSKSTLSGIKSSTVLVSRPKGRGFEPGQGYGFLTAIKIRSTSSFGWEVKPEVPCKILRHVTDLLKSHGDG
jgi:hypothetical protein